MIATCLIETFSRHAAPKHSYGSRCAHLLVHHAPGGARIGGARCSARCAARRCTVRCTVHCHFSLLPGVFASSGAQDRCTVQCTVHQKQVHGALHLGLHGALLKSVIEQSGGIGWGGPDHPSWRPPEYAQSAWPRPRKSSHESQSDHRRPQESSQGS